MIGKVTYLGAGRQPTASLTVRDWSNPDMELSFRFIDGESPRTVP